MTRKTRDEERDLEESMPEAEDGGIEPGMDLDGDLDEEDSDAAASLTRKDRRGRSRRMKAFIAAIIIIVLIIVGGLGAWWYKDSRRSVPGTGEHNRSSLGDSDTSEGSGTKDGVNQSRYLKSIGVPDYYAGLRGTQTKKQAQAAADAAVAGMPDNTETALSSLSSNPNLTDDMSKAFNADGSMNPNYSFLTAENVSRQVRDDMEVLVNPIYGSWTDLQSTTAGGVKNPAARFAGMFAPGGSDAVQNADFGAMRGLVPVFADWGSDNYGGKYAGRDYAPIVGTLGPVSCEYRISGTSDDTISCGADVTYHIMMRHGDVKTEAHSIRINYRPNYSGQDKDVSRRILIDSIQQQ